MFEWLEPYFFRVPFGLWSRFRLLLFSLFGITRGAKNRMESGRIRRISQIKMGALNHFSAGWCLWPADAPFSGKRIVIGNNNYFNRNVMIDANLLIEIGSDNMFGPDVYITDSNHKAGLDINPHHAPMECELVRIGNCCWIGAKAVILKGVELGDYCVVGAGAVVTRSFPPGSVVVGVPAAPMMKS